MRKNNNVSSIVYYNLRERLNIFYQRLLLFVIRGLQNNDILKTDLYKNQVTFFLILLVINSTIMF